MSIRVFLADDHTVMRDGIRSLLEQEENITVVGVAEDGREAVRLIRESQPDVAILDVTMPGLNGMDVTRQILTFLPDVKVIALSMHTSQQYVAGMIEAGAVGYLAKNCPTDELVEAIHTVRANRTFLSTGITDVVLEDYRRQLAGAEHGTKPVLTGREREVLQLLAEGKNPREAADILNLSIKTVANHRQRIMDKLNIYNMADLIKYAIREGLTSLDT